ncbi:MAG: hypothetical protein LBR80_13745 [Deltaproteobacteria bacterium]|nr:hypothetical protein [Deltaproteobacteria bacterium]
MTELEKDRVQFATKSDIEAAMAKILAEVAGLCGKVDGLCGKVDGLDRVAGIHTALLVVNLVAILTGVISLIIKHFSG